MYIIKRNGTEVEFDINKVKTAVAKANDATVETAKVSPATIEYVASEVADFVDAAMAALTVEDISDKIETVLMKVGPEVAKNFISYRYERMLVRKANTTDEQILSLIERTNEEA